VQQGYFTIVGVVLAAVLAAAQQATTGPTGQSGTTARAALVNASGKAVGDAYLEESANGVLLKVDLREAEPGIHGFHIHETGRCEAPSFTSAGGHFAPQSKQHGFLSADGPHAGDLPNAHVLVRGAASFEHFLPGMTLSRGEHGLLDADGAALVMHQSSDDYETDPGGESGGRIVCGVIMR